MVLSLVSAHMVHIGRRSLPFLAAACKACAYAPALPFKLMRKQRVHCSCYVQAGGVYELHGRWHGDEGKQCYGADCYRSALLHSHCNLSSVSRLHAAAASALSGNSARASEAHLRSSLTCLLVCTGQPSSLGLALRAQQCFWPWRCTLGQGTCTVESRKRADCQRIGILSIKDLP